jgi:uncharacterized protein YegL
MTTYPESDMSYEAKGLPAYLVLDTSSSMEKFETLLNNTLLHIYDTLYTQPEVSEFVHLSVISFNSDAHVVTPMTDIEQLESLPTLKCMGATNFVPMCKLVRDRIDQDVVALSAASVSVLRPVVFVLTDGAPTDRPVGTWKDGVALLKDRSWKRYPHIVTYGFGSASETVLKSLATAAAYMAEGDPSQTGEALSQALSHMLNSLVASAKTRQVELPPEIAGCRTLTLDPLMD